MGPERGVVLSKGCFKKKKVRRRRVRRCLQYASSEQKALWPTIPCRRHDQPHKISLRDQLLSAANPYCTLSYVLGSGHGTCILSLLLSWVGGTLDRIERFPCICRPARSLTVLVLFFFNSPVNQVVARIQLDQSTWNVGKWQESGGLAALFVDGDDPKPGIGLYAFVACSRLSPQAQPSDGGRPCGNSTPAYIVAFGFIVLGN